MSGADILRDFSPSDLLMASVAIVSLLGFASTSIKQALVLRPTLVRQGQVHRLLTGGWVHADFMHLAFNLVTLYFFAERVTSVVGMTKFLVLYVLAVIVAFIPSVIRFHRHSNYSTLGASGGVAAVMLAAILLHPKLEISLFLLPFRVPGLVFALVYLAYSAWQSRRSNNINHDAHFTGAVFGGLLTYLFEPDRVKRSLTIFGQYLGL